jgi:hypothetical protein
MGEAYDHGYEQPNIERAVNDALGRIEDGDGGEKTVRHLLPLAEIFMTDLRRLADAAERIAAALENSSAPKSPRG